MAQLGLDAKIYYGAAGTTAATALNNVMNVTVNVSKAEADVSTRDNDGWRQRIGTLKDASVDIELLYVAGDAGFEAIRDAFMNNGQVALLILDKAAGEGLDADFEVFEFTREEQLEEGIKYSINVKPGPGRTPTWQEPA